MMQTGFPSSLSLWRELNLSSSISILFVSLISTEAQSFCAVHCCCYQHRLSYSSFLLVEFFFSLGNLTWLAASKRLEHSSNIRPHMFTMQCCNGQLIWGQTSDVRVGSYSYDYFAVNLNHRTQACSCASCLCYTSPHIH